MESKHKFRPNPKSRLMDQVRKEPFLVQIAYEFN